MKNILLGPVAISLCLAAPTVAQSQTTSAFRAAQTAEPFVMPQSRARKIALALDDWTLNSGERPKSVRLARDCMSANGFVMQDSFKSGQNLDQTVMAGMSFWSSVNGAAIYQAEQNGGIEVQSEDDTAYNKQFATDDYKNAKADGRLPDFILDYYSECETIRRRFGG